MEEIPAVEQDVLTALRQATAQRHAELDSSMPLAASEVDLRAYRDHLRLLEQWLVPIQAWMARFDEGPKPPDYLAAIREDLAHPALVGISELSSAALIAGGADANVHASGSVSGSVSVGVSASVRPAIWPAQCGAGWRWGAAYVIEGSQLGGVVLYKKLAERLAPHPLDYLRGTGSPGPRWQRFLGDLREQVASPQQIADACEGAQQAFDSLIALNRARLAEISP